MTAPEVLLVDNGSLAPAATLRLRRLAAALAGRIGRPVAPVSLLHADKVPPDQLGGLAAETFAPALERRAVQGNAGCVVVPLFFGPTAALTEFVPGVVRRLRERRGRFDVRLAPPLFAEGDDRLARILADQAAAAASGAQRVVLVDHGSPLRAVAAVRDRLASRLAELLGDGFAVVAASMERRPEPEFDFSGPLLAEVLGRPEWNTGDVVVARQFLLPGRHAGPGGDVERICRDAEMEGRGRRIRLTPLVGEHPRLIEILADRWREGLKGAPIQD